MNSETLYTALKGPFFHLKTKNKFSSKNQGHPKRMAFFIYEADMSKDEILKAIRECARKIQRVPTLHDLRAHANINQKMLYSNFLSMGQMLREAGIEPIGAGHQQTDWNLLQDWGRIARKLGHVPNRGEYQARGKYSLHPFATRYRLWGLVREAFEKYVKTRGLEKDWQDVLKMIAADRAAKPLGAPPKTVTQRVKRKLLRGRKIYGEPLWMEAMAHAPTNEHGVLVLFGMVALRLGFIILKVQAEFPDGEVLREIRKGYWQLLRVEFEFESKNFVKHRHRKEDCHMIVCWEHNWVECPAGIEVVELRSAIAGIAEIARNRA